ncbi:MAG TPA: SUMF1/EgtB/PvdO family nonheme iron enzyme, partial [Myxococcota bacterium]|nr:SUMF1/EgtB/PvdO family nonheme iron enzyme [Myxococcota bacterium]
RLKMKELWKWFPLVALSPLFLSACGQTVCDSDMCEVPAGTFWMGCNEEVDDDCGRNEYPYHQVFLDGFMMDRTEVTYGAFMSCVDAGICTHHMDDATCYHRPDPTQPEVQGRPPPQSRREHMPMTCVDWDQASQYCEWVGKRLPTEAEWEKAARGNDGRKYPWGNDRWTCSLVVAMYDDNGWCGYDYAAEVCSTSPGGDSPYGLCDMAGNVWEWTSDWSDSNYYKQSPAENPRGPETGTLKSVRSGGVDYPPPYPIRSSRRWGVAPNNATFYRGFRCASDM